MKVEDMVLYCGVYDWNGSVVKTIGKMVWFNIEEYICLCNCFVRGRSEESCFVYEIEHLTVYRRIIGSLFEIF